MRIMLGAATTRTSDDNIDVRIQNVFMIEDKILSKLVLRPGRPASAIPDRD